MRIIDKNYDYYDYLQTRDDTIVFDRRGSFTLTKDIVCDKLHYSADIYSRKNFKHLLMQCGATYWVFLLKITKFDGNDRPGNYNVRLLATWKNYDNPRKVIDLTVVDFYAPYIKRQYREDKEIFIEEKVDPSYIQDMFNKYKHQVRYGRSLSSYVTYRDYSTKIEYTYPLLNACGIAELVSPVDVFNAIEEHFSLVKQEEERTEPLGATNDDKITMHGFDTKTSFRGKNK